MLAVIVFGVLAAFLLLRDDSKDRGLSAMSNRGRPIEMEIPARLGPWGKPTGEVILLAERGNVRFLRLPNEDGTSCWATGERRSGFWNLTNFNCETGFVRFPAPERPVMVVARQQANPIAETIVYDAFAGFAADGVKRIGVVDAENRLIEITNVVDNVFFTPDPPESVRYVTALDEAGEVIWRSEGVQRPDE